MAAVQALLLQRQQQQQQQQREKQEQQDAASSSSCSLSSPTFLEEAAASLRRPPSAHPGGLMGLAFGEGWIKRQQAMGAFGSAAAGSMPASSSSSSFASAAMANPLPGCSSPSSSSLDSGNEEDRAAAPMQEHIQEGAEEGEGAGEEEGLGAGFDPSLNGMAAQRRRAAPAAEGGPSPVGVSSSSPQALLPPLAAGATAINTGSSGSGGSGLAAFRRQQLPNPNIMAAPASHSASPATELAQSGASHLVLAASGFSATSSFYGSGISVAAAPLAAPLAAHNGDKSSNKQQQRSIFATMRKGNNADHQHHRDEDEDEDGSLLLSSNSNGLDLQRFAYSHHQATAAAAGTAAGATKATTTAKLRGGAANKAAAPPLLQVGGQGQEGMMMAVAVNAGAAAGAAAGGGGGGLHVSALHSHSHSHSYSHRPPLHSEDARNGNCNNKATMAGVDQELVDALFSSSSAPSPQEAVSSGLRSTGPMVGFKRKAPHAATGQEGLGLGLGQAGQGGEDRFFVTDRGAQVLSIAPSSSDQYDNNDDDDERGDGASSAAPASPKRARTEEREGLAGGTSGSASASLDAVAIAPGVTTGVTTGVAAVRRVTIPTATGKAAKNGQAGAAAAAAASASGPPLSLGSLAAFARPLGSTSATNVHRLSSKGGALSRQIAKVAAVTAAAPAPLLPAAVPRQAFVAVPAAVTNANINAVAGPPVLSTAAVAALRRPLLPQMGRSSSSSSAPLLPAESPFFDSNEAFGIREHQRERTIRLPVESDEADDEQGGGQGGKRGFLAYVAGFYPSDPAAVAADTSVPAGLEGIPLNDWRYRRGGSEAAEQEEQKEEEEEAWDQAFALAERKAQRQAAQGEEQAEEASAWVPVPGLPAAVAAGAAAMMRRPVRLNITTGSSEAPVADSSSSSASSAVPVPLASSRKASVDLDEDENKENAAPVPVAAEDQTVLGLGVSKAVMRKPVVPPSVLPSVPAPTMTAAAPVPALDLPSLPSGIDFSPPRRNR